MKEAWAKQRAFGRTKTVGFTAILIVLVMGTAEIAVRAWVYLFRDPAERFDFTTGTFILRPGEYPRHGMPAIRVNSRGFVGPEFEEPRAPGVTRIVTLGDSCTFRPGTVEEPYPARLAIRLNAGEGAPRYQVVNAGIDGLTSELALRRLTAKVITLRPDIVTVYLGWNDLVKFDPAGQIEYPGLMLVVRAVDRLWLTRGMRKLLFYYIRPHFSAPTTGRASRTGAFATFRPSVFERNLQSIIVEIRDAGAKTLVMTLPSVVSDGMSLDDLHRANVIFPFYSSAYAVGDYVDLIAAYNRSIRRVAGAEGIPLVDLAQMIEEQPDRRPLFIDTMHLSERGRELVASSLAHGLQESGLVGR